jgi:hypothetical protein
VVGVQVLADWAVVSGSYAWESTLSILFGFGNEPGDDEEAEGVGVAFGSIGVAGMWKDAVPTASGRLLPGE